MTSVSRSIPVKAQPWLERSGKFSLLKLGVFIGVFLPGLWLGLALSQGWLGPKPITEAIHGTGQWAVRLLVISLAITPLRRIAQLNKLLLVRRMLGLAALAYLVVHFVLYVISLHFDLRMVASEIVFRIYLTIGFVALAGFSFLGATSTDAMIRRIGPQRWNRLHQAVYVLIALGLLHFFMQAKIDVTEPALMTGFFILLMGHRLLAKFRLGESILALLALAIAAGLLTALEEAGWYAVASGVPAARVLQANLDYDLSDLTSIRPAWWVLLAGLALVLIRVARPIWSSKPSAPSRARARV